MDSSRAGAIRLGISREAKALQQKNAEDVQRGIAVTGLQLLRGTVTEVTTVDGRPFVKIRRATSIDPETQGPGPEDPEPYPVGWGGTPAVGDFVFGVEHKGGGVVGGLAAGAIAPPPAPVVDPIAAPALFDDFMAGGVGTGDIGSLGWELTNGSTAQVAAETGRPGIIRRTTAATADQVIATYLLGVGAFLASEMFDVTFAFRPSTGYAGIQSTLRFGLMDTITGIPVNGIYVDHINTVGNNILRLHCRTASVSTVVDSAVLLALGTWVKVRIRRLDASTVGFTLNDGTEATINTNVPAGSLLPNFQYQTGSNVARGYDLDYFRLNLVGLTR